MLTPIFNYFIVKGIRIRTCLQRNLQGIINQVLGKQHRFFRRKSIISDSGIYKTEPAWARKIQLVILSPTVFKIKSAVWKPNCCSSYISRFFRIGKTTADNHRIPEREQILYSAIPNYLCSFQKISDINICKSCIHRITGIANSKIFRGKKSLAYGKIFNLLHKLRHYFCFNYWTGNSPKSSTGIYTLTRQIGRNIELGNLR